MRPLSPCTSSLSFVLALAALGLGPAPPARAGLELPSMISDHMVLQREREVPLWGWADPGQEVRVRASWSSEEVVAGTDRDGRWHVALQTPEAGGPHSIRFSAGETIEVSDVLVGDVWLCSGQSNMEWTIANTAFSDRSPEDYREAVAAADHPRLRVFDVPNVISIEPEERCGGQWVASTPDTVERFSAVAYFFGLELQRELGVPIGLVCSDWGGTPCEAWTSDMGLDGHGEFELPLARLRVAEKNPDRMGASLRDLQAQWWRDLEAADPGWEGAWWSVGLDDGEWSTMDLPAEWGSKGLGSFDGSVWFRREVEIPDGWKGLDLHLSLGPIDDMDVTWFDGHEIAATRVDGQWNQPRSYVIPGKLVKGGRTVIAVCAVDTGGAGGLNGAEDSLSLSPADGEGIALSGAWRYQRGLALGQHRPWPRDAWFHSNYPTALFNGMIAPLVPYEIRGVIWYQGESNRTRAAQYRWLFPAMMRDWRVWWAFGPRPEGPAASNRENADFPFYYVQIAPFRYGGDTGEAAELREAQLMALSTRNTGMAVTMDIGNPADIHPRNKEDVGHRLALLALARTYGREGLVCIGPVYRTHSAVGGYVRLHLDEAHGGLVARGGPLTHFTIAGADRVFHPAEAVIEGDTIKVSSPEVPEPLAVRYAWGAADVPNLFNGAGLPASSFRTDDWPRR